MTQQVRAGYRRHRKATWAAVFGVLVAVMLAIAIPALGQSTTSATGVAPPSGQDVYPATANVGGSNFSCSNAGDSMYPSGSPTPAGMRQFQISKPTPGSYTDPATGITFTISGPTSDSGLDPKSSFSFSVSGNAAVVYHVGINGGTKTEWYDYYNNAPKTPAIAGRGVYGDKNLHSTPDSKYSSSNFSFYTASITTFCYKALTVAPLCTSPFTGNAFGGTAGGVEYSAQLVSPDGLTCKGSDVVMYSYTSGTSSFFATLNPLTEDPSAPKYRVIERIRWSGITSDSQNLVPDLWYDDTYPYDGVDKKTLKMCNLDARSTSNPFTLANDPATGAPYTDGQILPAGETSCMFLSSNSAGTSTTNRIYEAWLYSNVDGARGVT